MLGGAAVEKGRVIWREMWKESALPSKARWVGVSAHVRRDDHHFRSSQSKLHFIHSHSQVTCFSIEQCQRKSEKSDSREKLNRVGDNDSAPRREPGLAPSLSPVQGFVPRLDGF